MEPLECRHLLTNVSGVISSSTTWFATNSPYVITSSVYVENGATLTIQRNVTVQGGGLYIDDNGSGGGISADTVNFQNSRVELDQGATASLYKVEFLSNNVYVDATLASSLSNCSFPGSSTVGVLYGTLTTSAILPGIVNVTAYSLGGLYIDSGGSLVIASPSAITGAGLYVDDAGSGGTLAANSVTFENSRVELDFGAMVNLTNDHFLSNNVYVDATLANSLSGNVFPYGSTVSVLYGTLKTFAGLPRIVNVAAYSLAGLYIDGGGSLSIGDQDTITGAGLYVDDDGSGGTLSAMGVTFQNSRVELDAGATASLGTDYFLSNNVFVDATLATSLSGNTFPANSTVGVLYGNLKTSATLPYMSNVTAYSLGGLYVENGATLAIAGQNTITGSELYVDDDGSGGALVAEGVTFNNQLSLGAGSTGTIEYDRFTSSGYNYFDGQMAAVVTNDDFSASQAAAQGSVGPPVPTVNLEGNWWGSTDQNWIRQNKIYDYNTNNNQGVPIIDIGSPLARPPVPPPPTVNNVLVCGSGWSSTFAYVAGYAIPVGSGAQLATLPWNNINEVTIVFSESVTVAQGELALTGVNTPAYNVGGGSFVYDAATFTATWTLPQAIGADKLLIDLSAEGGNPIQDWAGERLDGEWTNGSSTYPSGNGTAAGTDFLFRFNVLPGDVDQNGLVQAYDGLLVCGALGSTPGTGNYTPFKDINGDGQITTADSAAVKSALGTVLPAGNPVAGPFRSFAPLLTTGAADDSDSGASSPAGATRGPSSPAAGALAAGAKAGSGRSSAWPSDPGPRIAPSASANRAASPAAPAHGRSGPFFKHPVVLSGPKLVDAALAATRAWGKTA
jgi:hypothetical protein